MFVWTKNMDDVENISYTDLRGMYKAKNNTTRRAFFDFMPRV